MFFSGLNVVWGSGALLFGIGCSFLGTRLVTVVKNMLFIPSSRIFFIMFCFVLMDPEHQNTDALVLDDCPQEVKTFLNNYRIAPKNPPFYIHSLIKSRAPQSVINVSAESFPGNISRRQEIIRYRETARALSFSFKQIPKKTHFGGPVSFQISSNQAFLRVYIELPNTGTGQDMNSFQNIRLPPKKSDSNTKTNTIRSQNDNAWPNHVNLINNMLQESNAWTGLQILQTLNPIEHAWDALGRHQAKMPSGSYNTSHFTRIRVMIPQDLTSLTVFR